MVRRVDSARYLVLSADYLDFSIRDVAAGEIDRAALSDEVGEALRSWNCDYQPIIPLTAGERADPRIRDRIAELDEQGMALAELLASEMPDVREVRYYSEGALSGSAVARPGDASVGTTGDLTIR